MKRLILLPFLFLVGCSSESVVNEDLEMRIYDLEEQNESLISDIEELRSGLEDALYGMRI